MRTLSLLVNFSTLSVWFGQNHSIFQLAGPTTTLEQTNTLSGSDVPAFQALIPSNLSNRALTHQADFPVAPAAGRRGGP